jgi:hypothetical protein
MGKFAVAVLELLIHEDRPWAVDELAREIGDRIDTVDAIADLHGHGLVNKIGADYVIASRAALCSHALQQGGGDA